MDQLRLPKRNMAAENGRIIELTLMYVCNS